MPSVPAQPKTDAPFGVQKYCVFSLQHSIPTAASPYRFAGIFHMFCPFSPPCIICCFHFADTLKAFFPESIRYLKIKYSARKKRSRLPHCIVTSRVINITSNKIPTKRIIPFIYPLLSFPIIFCSYLSSVFFPIAWAICLIAISI